MSNTINIKSIHVDFPDGIKRVRVKISYNNTRIKDTLTLNSENIYTQKDIVKQLKELYPEHKITGHESW